MLPERPTLQRSPTADPAGLRPGWRDVFRGNRPPSERALRPGEPLIVVVASDSGGETGDRRVVAGPREHRCVEALVCGV
jgi:hypothetical protein